MLVYLYKMMHIGLVGATNVGKSTLFNRLIGQFRAIVTDIPGTTTDILRHPADVPGIGKVTFLDSPGLHDFTEEVPFIQYIVDHSDMILFIIDDGAGISAKEHYIFDYILKTNSKKKVILVVNKLDKKHKSTDYDLAIADYYTLGFEHVVGVSALNQINIEILQEMMIEFINDNPKLKDAQDELEKLKQEHSGISFAIVGKPNAGKSTMLNTFVGQYLSKVEDKAGTTRDYIVTDFTYENQDFTIFDTAGIKRVGHMHGIEKIAYTKTKDMLEYIRPVVVIMMDATEGISHRDMTLISEVYNLALPMVIALNKVDMLTKKEVTHVIKETQAKMDFAKYIPIVPMVAKTGQGIPDLMKMIRAIHAEATKRVDTNELNKVIAQDMLTRPPRFSKNKICKIMFITQVDINAPTFMVFVNYVERSNFAFKKWIDNTLRKYFGFVGTPLVIKFK